MSRDAHSQLANSKSKIERYLKRYLVPFGKAVSQKVPGTFWVFGFLAIFFLPASAFAVSNVTNEDIANLPSKPPVTTIVSAARREMSVEKSTRFMTVITREEIEKSGKVFVADLIREVAGVTVTQAGPAGRSAEVFIRGSNSNQLLFMIDDVEINSLTTGLPALENLTTENIERIEILRGPQSVLYGSKAIGGIINIITKSKPKAGIHGSGKFQYGTYNTFDESGDWSGSWKDFSFVGTGGRLDTRGPGENDGFENTRASAHGRLQTSSNSELEMAFQYYHALAGIEDGAFQEDPNYWNRSQSQIAKGKYTISLKDWWQQSVQYIFFHESLLSVDPANNSSESESRFKLDANRHKFEYQSDFFISDFDVLTAGYEFEYGNANNKSFDKIVHNHGWFAQNELTLWKIWTIVTGARVDRHDLFGTEVSPLASSALWIEKTMTKIKGSFGKGFRAPTLNELFFPNFGNTALRPEISWGWDAGFEQFFWNKRESFSAAYFHSAVKNLIEYDANFIPQNISRARTQGVELEERIRVWKSLTLFGNYTYTDTRNRETGKRLIRRPLNQGTVGLSFDFWRFHYQVDWRFVGVRDDQTGIFGRPAREKNQGYTNLGMALYYDLTKYFQLFGRVENATNNHYDDVLGYESPNARFIAGTKGKF